MNNILDMALFNIPSTNMKARICDTPLTPSYQGLNIYVVGKYILEDVASQVHTVHAKNYQ